jgi:hypothetical protein
MDAIHNRRPGEIGRTRPPTVVRDLAVFARGLSCKRPGKTLRLPSAVALFRCLLRAIDMFITIISRRFRSSAFPIAAMAACLLSAPAIAVESQAGVGFLEKLAVSVAPSPVVTVCHGFGCAYRNQLVLTPARFSYMRETLQSAHSASEERKAISKVVAWFDREGGRIAGTVGRVAYAGVDTKSGPSQMDCIDLTANITELLMVLNRARLLKYHQVGEPVSRGFIIDGKQPHTTPVIVEVANGSQWSVDSWTRAYGQSPDIMTISEWQNGN